MIRGIGHSVGAFTGLGFVSGGNQLAVAVFVFAVLATAGALATGRKPPALAAASLLAVGAMYVIIGLVRSQFESDFATRSRYVYVASLLFVLAVTGLLPRLRALAQRTRHGTLGLAGALSVVLAAVTAANVAAFGPIHARFQANANLTRAYIELALVHPGRQMGRPRLRPA